MGEKEKLELYKLCVDMADKTSERRLKNNTFIITLNTGLISLNSFISVSGSNQQVWSVILCIVSIIINIYWVFLISTYKKINEAKYSIINRMEVKFSFDIKPFSSEYKFLIRRKYFHLSTIEKLIPITLILLNIIIILFIFNVDTIQKSNNYPMIFNIISQGV